MAIDRAMIHAIIMRCSSEADAMNLVPTGTHKDGGSCHEDRHKAPTSSPPFPLSLQDWGEGGRFIVEAGAVGWMGGDPCGRLSCNLVFIILSRFIVTCFCHRLIFIYCRFALFLQQSQAFFDEDVDGVFVLLAGFHGGEGAAGVTLAQRAIIRPGEITKLVVEFDFFKSGPRALFGLGPRCRCGG